MVISDHDLHSELYEAILDFQFPDNLLMFKGYVIEYASVPKWNPGCYL